MKRNVEEIFEFEGRYYKAVKENNNGCNECVFKYTCDNYRDIIGWCSATNRHENTGVIFVEVNKPVEAITSNPSDKKKLLLII